MPTVGRRALIFSFHNWSTRREGGFHRFAASLCGAGFEVTFVSFPRPWYGFLKRSERLGARALLSLLRGCEYEVRGGRLLNVASLSLSIPGPLRACVPEPWRARLEKVTVPNVLTRCFRLLGGVDVVMFESTECVLLYPEVRRRFPEAVTIYRPSDPLAADKRHGRTILEAEGRILKEADLVALVNEEGRSLYAGTFPGVNLDPPRVVVLPNGIDLAAYQRDYPRPSQYGSRPVVLYIGAHIPAWEIIVAAAQKLPGFDFHVVCPEHPSKKAWRRLSALPNLKYTPGVEPAAVPPLIQHCNVIIVPYPPGEWRIKGFGLTAKLMQAMAAGKPIVAMNVSPELSRFGISIANNVTEFCELIRKAAEGPPPEWGINLREYDWTALEQRFLELVGEALQNRKGLTSVRQA